MSNKTIGILGTLGLVALLALGYCGMSCTKIDAGRVGVSVKKCSGGGVDPTPIPTGYYMRSVFCEDVFEYPTSLQTIVLAETGSDKSHSSILVNSREGLPINVDVSLSFTLTPTKVPALYTKFRSEIETITSTFVRQTVRESLQIEFAKYTAEEIYAEKKEIVREAAQKFLTAKLSPDGFEISQFTLNDVRVPPQVRQAIDAKVAMTQEAQKAEAEVRKTEALAKQRIAQAQGEADALRLKADAEAYYNTTVAKSITDTYLNYKAQEKWDGKLPQFSGGGAVPFISIPAGK